MLLWFSTLSFAGSIIFGICCLVQWFLKGRRYFFHILFGVSFLSLFWFQLPMIFAYLGMRFVLSDYSQMLSVAFPLSFAGAVLLYVGFVRALKFPLSKLTRTIYVVLFGVSFVVCGWSIFYGDGRFNTPRAITFPVIIIFFASPHILTLEVLWRAFRQDFYRSIKTALLFGQAAFALIVLQDIMASIKIFQYPPGLLFIGLINYEPLFYLQALSTSFTILAILLMQKFSMNLSDIRQDIKQAVKQNRALT